MESFLHEQIGYLIRVCVCSFVVSGTLRHVKNMLFPIPLNFGHSCNIERNMLIAVLLVVL